VSGVDIFIAVTMFLTTVLLGHLIKWVVGNFVTEREASISSFAFLLGQSLALRIADVSKSEVGAVIEAIGLILGLAVLWWLFFKRKVAHG
jgi:hypothetical protein